MNSGQCVVEQGCNEESGSATAARLFDDCVYEAIILLILFIIRLAKFIVGEHSGHDQPTIRQH